MSSMLHCVSFQSVRFRRWAATSPNPLVPGRFRCRAAVVPIDRRTVTETDRVALAWQSAVVARRLERALNETQPARRRCSGRKKTRARTNHWKYCAEQRRRTSVGSHGVRRRRLKKNWKKKQLLDRRGEPDLYSWSNVKLLWCTGDTWKMMNVKCFADVGVKWSCEPKRSSRMVVKRPSNGA